MVLQCCRLRRNVSGAASTITHCLHLCAHLAIYLPSLRLRFEIVTTVSRWLVISDRVVLAFGSAGLVPLGYARLLTRSQFKLSVEVGQPPVLEFRPPFEQTQTLGSDFIYVVPCQSVQTPLLCPFKN